MEDKQAAYNTLDFILGEREEHPEWFRWMVCCTEGDDGATRIRSTSICRVERSFTKGVRSHAWQGSRSCMYWRRAKATRALRLRTKRIACIL